MIFDSTGALYGTTFAGGYNGYGTVFKLTPPSTPGGAWSESVLCSIRGGCGGSGYPHAGLTIDSAGALYGTTTSEESASSVFKVTPPSTPGGSWTGSLLHYFNDYQGPGVYAGVIFDSSGALYGTDSEDIVFPSSCPPDIFVGCGIVFKLTPPSTPGGTWTESTLHIFSGSDGANPKAGLISDSAGALYGTTAEGGVYDAGTVFKLVSFAGLRGQPNCIGKSISALARKFGGLAAAAAALGYSSVQDLHDAVVGYCGG